MKTLNVSFKEEQRINQWWLRLILLITLGVVLYSIYRFYQVDEQSTNDHLAFWPGVLIGLAAVALVWFWKLTTTIDNYGLQIKCPFVNKKVKWDEIEKLEVLDYGFVGGWGVRIGTKYGTAYNTSGSKGMAIELKNKKKFLVGTQREDELKKIVEKWKNM